MAFSIFLLGLRYLFVLLLLLFIFRLVKWMVSDLMTSGGSYSAVLSPSHPPQEERPPVKRDFREAGGVRLTVLESSLPGLEKGDIFGVAGGEIVIGRSSDSDVLVADTFISSRHARIYLMKEQYWLEDLSSTNGTFLNGVQIDKPTVLAEGDRIQVGDVIFQFVRWGHEVGSSN